MKNKVYKIRGMNCESCAKMIEIDMEDAGVKASCDFVKETLLVEDKEGPEYKRKIKDIIKNAGYELIEDTKHD